MLRRPSIRSTVTTLAAAAVLVGGADLASYAATGHPLVLGHSNAAGTTTALKNTGRGPALSLNSSKHAPPLVVNSSKLVKHLNADKLQGKSATQLNPKVMRWHIGSSGTVVANGAQKLFTAQVPKGTYEIIWNAFMNRTSVPTTDNYQCLAADYNKLVGHMDLSGYWALDGNTWGEFDSGLIHDTNPVQTVTHKTKMLFGCLFSGSTGTITYVQPPTLTLHKISVSNKSGHRFTVKSGTGPRLGLMH
jgi:hypothetical protein